MYSKSINVVRKNASTYVLSFNCCLKEFFIKNKVMNQPETLYHVKEGQSNTHTKRNKKQKNVSSSTHPPLPPKLDNSFVLKK